MKIPAYPANEPLRLHTLRSLKILDTQPEERFDRITRIAKRVFDVPITLVSLIDAERQWFKSRQGLDVCETSRDISFCGHAILQNSVFVVPDTLLDQRFCDSPLVTQGPKIRFYAGVPLTLGNGSNLGTLCIIDQMPRAFSAEDQQLLLDLGQIAQQELLAVQLNIIDELKQRNAEMKLLSEISDFLQACLTVEEACGAIASLIAPLFPGCAGGIFTLGVSLSRVENVAYWGEALVSKPDFSLQECWGLRRGRVHWVQGPDRPRCAHVPTDPGSAVTLCIPMIAQGETLGLFYLSAVTPEVLPEAKQQLARTVTEQVGMAIANLHLRETLQRQSIRDPLTGLYNRHYLEESLNQEIARGQRHQHPISVIMLDVDHLKQFNATHGHDVGDAVLQAVGTLLKESVRGSDLACRYGGEELALILPETTLEEASGRAEEIRSAIAQLVIFYNGQQIENLTVSLGVSAFPHHGSTGVDLLRSADAALYQAKAAGCNYVMLAP